MTGVKLTIQNGAAVVYEVTDPQGLKPQEKEGVQPVAMFGVVSDIGSQHYARFHFSQQGKHTYVFNVPYGRKMTVRVTPVTVAVKDDLGRAVGEAASAVAANSFTVARGDPPKKVAFSIVAMPGK